MDNPFVSDMDGICRRCSMCGAYAIDCERLIVGKFGSICSDCIVSCVLILGEAQQEDYLLGVIDPPKLS